MNTKKIKARSHLGKRIAKNVPGLTVLLIWTAFTAVMIGWIVLASFSTTREIFQGKLLKTGFHLNNYGKALFSNNVALYLLNGLFYTVCGVAISLAISIPAAYALSRFRFRGNKIIQYFFVAGQGVPTVMIMMPLYAIAVKTGLSNTRTGLIAMYVFILIPFTTYFLIGFFMGIPTSIEEAALVDGASNDRTLWQIMMPMASPGILTVVIFNFLTLFEEYFIALSFITKAELRQAGLGLYSMVQNMTYTGDWAGLFASVMLIFLPSFILYLCLNRFILGGVTAGAVKG